MSVTAPGITSADTFDSKPAASERAMLSDGFCAILGAGRRETA